MTYAIPFAFRVVGNTTQRRRLVDAGAALAGYASCDRRAETEKESYLSAFCFGDDFRLFLRQTGSTKGFDGACWAPFLWFDIDNPDDPERALCDARRLAASILERYQALDDDALLLFFSGSKGYHVGLPTFWGAAPSRMFHRTARHFAETLAAAAGAKIDAGVYDKVRCFRAPNSKHPKTGLHKRRLSFDELLHLSVERIRQLAAEPTPFELPAVERSERIAAAEWSAALRAVEEQLTENAERKAAAGNGPPALNRSTWEFIREGANDGDRHRLLFSAAANLGEFRCPPALAHALLTEAGLDSGLPPREVHRQIECGLSHVATTDGGPHA